MPPRVHLDRFVSYTSVQASKAGQYCACVFEHDFGGKLERICFTL